MLQHDRNESSGGGGGEKTLWERQIELESQALHDGFSRYLARDRTLQQQGIAGETDWGARVISSNIEPLIRAIQELLESAKTRAGRRHAITPLFDRLPVELVAFITARSVIDDTFSLSDASTLTSIAVHIADRVLTESQAREFKKQEARLFATVEGRLERKSGVTDEKVRISTLRHAAKKFEVPISTWSKSTRAQVGRTLLELFIESTKLVTVEKGRKGRKTTERLVASNQLNGWVANFRGKSRLLHPILMPMIEPPLPWTSLNDGGYLTIRRQLLKRYGTRAYREELLRADMAEVYTSVNALQNTSWRVNGWLYEQVCKAVDAGLHVGETLVGSDAPLPPKGEWEKDSPEHKAWKAKAAEVFRFNKKNQGRKIQQVRTLYVADKFKDETAIYFPYQLDFRGRVYALPSFLNPQGNDLAKGLLEFGDGKPLGESGAWWLYVHAANCFGVDKVSFEERVEWTETNRSRLVGIAEDPFSDLWWMEADSPWQFLAACRAVADFVSAGIGSICHLPVAVDGSNNGLQHFAAMLRDSECGSEVNLVPTEQPADIYSAVAKAVTGALKAKKDQDDLARLWLRFGIDRKVCKRPVMIVPYGGTRDGVRSYIIDAIDERKDHPFPQRVGEASSYLSNIIWEVMAGLMPGPRGAMDWLQYAAREVAKKNKPVTWTCPNKFIAQQAYYKPVIKPLECYVFGRRITFKTKIGDQPKLDLKKQVQSFSPNFVHSLDAAALTGTVNAGVRQGLTHFACVHDSYGTHACDVEQLQRCIREEFVTIYSQDVLADLKSQLDPLLDKPLREPPPRGDLDIGLVKQSDYFFA